MNDAVNEIPSRTTVPKPVSVNVTLYAPGTNAMIRNCPWLSVKAVRVFSMSAGLEASTATPGSTAPLESRTTPAICAFCATARDGTSVNASNKTTETHVSRVIMLLPPTDSGRSFSNRLRRASLNSLRGRRIAAELYYRVHARQRSSARGGVQKATDALRSKYMGSRIVGAGSRANRGDARLSTET